MVIDESYYWGSLAYEDNISSLHPASIPLAIGLAVCACCGWAAALLEVLPIMVLFSPRVSMIFL